ncbi:3-oxoacyl-ACP reductase [Rhodococcoides trifolii]|uniref:3-oxoacyl-ACP reductase n=1 Tax=Rhodococcoides trifolii TaxID=908250 RepID=A0A917CYV0_9NOCA|nr:SDR family oxidoreductase [Rhodococcus trifolii]GGG02604.1 3-oxoacyl-ACP reductase [Rhodococcus trifolii]
MLLEGKNAVIYGGAGRIGTAVAMAFAREGAKVHLAGRTLSTMTTVVEKIQAFGGKAEAALVDALDEVDVDEHVDIMAACSGSVDISFNLMALDDVRGIPLADMELRDFERPILNAIRSQFITTRAAARHMKCQESGVILMFGHSSSGEQSHLGGFQVALGALDVMRCQLSDELAPKGIRVLTIDSAGVGETVPLDDVGTVAAFAASDLARSMTGTSLGVAQDRPRPTYRTRAVG